MSEISIKHLPPFPGLYLILELEADGTATHLEIKAAHRRLTKVYLPDADRGNLEATERMKQINQAKDTLLNPEKRAAYDQGIGQQERDSEEANFDTWDDADSSLGNVTRGQNIEAEAVISPKVAYLGGPATVTVFRKNGMSRLTIQIPPNTKTGRMLRVQGKGENGLFGGVSGDVLVKIKVQEERTPSSIELHTWLDTPTYKALRGKDRVLIKQAKTADGVAVAPFEIPSIFEFRNWDPDNTMLHLEKWYRAEPWEKPRDLYLVFWPTPDLKVYLRNESLSDAFRKLWNSVRGKNN